MIDYAKFITPGRAPGIYHAARGMPGYGNGWQATFYNGIWHIRNGHRYITAGTLADGARAIRAAIR